MSYKDLISDPRRTPQTEKADKRQVENHEGGFVFKLEPFQQLERFLVLGSDTGTFYASAKAITTENAGVVRACLDLDTERTMELIGKISDEGRAASNDPAIVALALAIGHPSVTTKQARALVKKVIRIGTHLFTLCDLIKKTRGWGRKARRSVAMFYEQRDAAQMAFQAAKYQQRNGWSHRDALRVSHPTIYDEDKQAVADWICKRPAELPPLLSEIEELKSITHLTEIAHRVAKNKSLTWEMLPSAALKSPEVWENMITRGMPLGALLRNLGRLGSLGLLKPMTVTTGIVARQLVDREALIKARVHPIAILKAAKVYARGCGIKGSLTWRVCPEIIEALNKMFDLSFDLIEPSNKRTFLAIDVSGSMGSPCAGAELISCAEGAAVMAMITLRTEKMAYARGFTSAGSWGSKTDFKDLELNRTMSLAQVMAQTRKFNFGGTDCSLPMQWALENKIEVDTFVVYTDSETYQGTMHAHQALAEYRRKMGIDAKMVVVGMNSSGFTIADPTDAGMLDCVGFDTATPSIIANFSKS